MGNLISKTGICDEDDFPDLTQTAFTEIAVEDVIIIPNHKPKIEQILEVIAQPEIIRKELIRTPKGTEPEGPIESAGGEILTGWKLVIEGKINQKVEYVGKTTTNTQPMHAVHGNSFFSTFIVIPQAAIDNGITKNDVDEINIDICIEDIFVNQIDDCKIFKNIIVIINATSNLFAPSAQAAMTEEELCNSKNYK